MNTPEEIVQAGEMLREAGFETSTIKAIIDSVAASIVREAQRLCPESKDMAEVGFHRGTIYGVTALVEKLLSLPEMAEEIRRQSREKKEGPRHRPASDHDAEAESRFFGTSGSHLS